MITDVEIVASAAARSSVNISEVSCRDGGDTGVWWWASIVVGTDALAVSESSDQVFDLVCL